MLSVKQIAAFKPRAKPFKIFDSGGLFIQVTPSGSKLWRMKYTLDGREKLLSFGEFPLVSLADARQRRDDARRELANHKDPATERMKAKAAAAASRAMTVGSICREWHAINKTRWSPRHSVEVLKSLETDVFPAIGRLPIADLTAPVLLDALRPIWERGAIETAHRIRQRLEAAFDYGAACSTDQTDNAARKVRNALPALLKKGKQPAVLTLHEARQLLDRVDDQPSHVVTKLANRLMALTAVRPGTLRFTRWSDSEFRDLDGPDPVWHIPAQRLKLGVAQKGDDEFDLLVPLSAPAVAAIRTLQQVTSACVYVFPNTRMSTRPMSENAVNYLLHRAGFHGRHSGHGWRASFSTIMNGVAQENGTSEIDRPIIDLMLAHVPPNKVEGRYNRFQYLQRRREIANHWAELLMDGRSTSAELLNLRKR